MKRSYVGKSLPGASGFPIRDGPMKTSFNMARDRRLFLPRNTRRGSDFLRRREGLFEKGALAAVEKCIFQELSHATFTCDEESSCSVYGAGTGDAATLKEADTKFEDIESIVMNDSEPETV